MADFEASGSLQSSNSTVSGTTLPHFEMAEGAATPGSTTQRLSGLTGTFGSGRIEELVNPSGTTTDVAEDGNREDVWSIQATVDSQQISYDFRVLYGGEVSETITVTPQVTVVNTASGALQSGTSTVSGTATKVSVSSGVLQSGVATVSGTATKASVASGALQSGTATIAGAATKVSIASGSLESADSTVAGTATQAAIASGSLQASVATVAGTATSSVKEQAAFRFYADGTESGSSVLADQNVDITIAKEVIFQLRVGMQSTGDLNAETATLQYRPTSGGTWRNV